MSFAHCLHLLHRLPSEQLDRHAARVQAVRYALASNARNDDDALNDGSGDDKGTSVELLTEFVNLLRQSGARFDESDVGFPKASEPPWWAKRCVSGSRCAIILGSKRLRLHLHHPDRRRHVVDPGDAVAQRRVDPGARGEALRFVPLPVRGAAVCVCAGVNVGQALACREQRQRHDRLKPVPISASGALAPP